MRGTVRSHVVFHRGLSSATLQNVQVWTGRRRECHLNDCRIMFLIAPVDEGFLQIPPTSLRRGVFGDDMEMLRRTPAGTHF